MAEIALGWADRGQHRDVAVGDLLRVSLWGNATTGFFWSPLPTGDVLELVTDEERVDPDLDPSAAPAVLGTGAASSTVFRARRPGTQELRIRYWRGVEAPEDLVYAVTVTVSG